MTGFMERLDDIPRPAWIALVVVSFILFWPIGLALLIYLKWSGRMFCSRHGRYGQWYGPEGREARREAREEWRAWKRRHRWGQSSSGNVAFDEYREETLRKLDEEQRERLQQRLDDPAKHWKFSLGDLEVRKRWDDYQAAYSAAIGATGTSWAPWTIVPADSKTHRNLMIARVIEGVLTRLKLRYPTGDSRLFGLKVE